MHSQTERCEQLKDEHIFCTPNRLNSHTDYRKRKNAASELADFSDVFALNNLLENLDGGKFGSVTKDYEKIHAQRMQVINFLSSWRSSLPNGSSSLGPKCSQGGLNTNSDPSMCQNLVRSDLYPSVVDLDGNSVVVAPANNHFVEHSFRNFAEVTLNNNVQNMSQSPTSFISRIKNKVSYVPSGTSNLPGMKDGEVNTSIIILESDDEEDCQVEKLSSKCEREAYNSQDRLESNLQICLRQEKILPPVNHFNQLVPYNQHYSKVDRYAAVEPRWQPSIQFEKIVLGDVSDQKPVSRRVTKQKPILDPMGEKHVGVSRKRKREGEALTIGANRDKDSVIVPSPISSLPAHEHSFSTESHNHDDTETQRDELEDLWKDMSLAMECSKTAATSDGSALVQKEEECIHSYVLEDDLGLVCRICGVIQKSIETIFDNQWVKGSRSTRTFMSRSRNPDDLDEAIEFSGPQISEDIIAAEISVHPRHMKQMKPHQLEGFSFLVRNLVSDKPGGCILAHAPGSGKTFMLISFIQSFLAKYPHARPLVVLPKGILPTWKREFQRWQVEDIPLFDFYSSKADNRYQQLDVLKSWEENKSILFLGYKQFATIVCGRTDCKVGVACQERLLKVPSLLILDEGHTPRNENTDVLTSLAKVQTPRKVVLSGTLFQNHVREVFNILNLVRPKFLKSETSRAVVKRVLSRVHISGGTRIHFKGTVSNQFYDLIEETLQNDDNHNHKRKTTVIQDLRELTHNVLHYYKGDFLDELPGLVDFTVLLKLSDKQKEIIQRLGKYEKFKRSIVGKFKKSSVGNSVYIHPYLRDISENAANDRASLINDDRIDGILDSMDVSDGVKTKFFLNILSMAEAAGEKLLAFSQYLLPMKFLERLIVRVKGWRLGKEIFMITGDSSAENREWSMDQFNNSPDAKVLFGSIKACGEGISLVGASRVLILDVHLNPSVTRQAIGRAFRPGQNKKVYVYRLVAADSPEEEDHCTAFRKELISKMWFEWSEYSGHRDFELEEIDVADSQDVFLESPTLSEDVQILYRR